MNTTYREIPLMIEQKLSFIGNSTRAERIGDDYKIYSYSTLIYSSKDNYFSIDRYSHTTTKLQNIIAKVYYKKTIQQMRKEKEYGIELKEYSQY